MANRRQKKPNSIEETKLDEAKKLYMENVPVSEIARHLDLKRSSLQYYVDKEWRNDRESLHLEEFTEFMQTRQSAVTQVTRDALQVMKRGMAYLKNRNVPPTVDEVNKAAKAIEILSKVSPKKENAEENYLEQFEKQGELHAQPKKDTKEKKEDIIDVKEYKDPFE